ncbi:glutamine synthetase [Streptomyces sp. NPDC058751]
MARIVRGRPAPHEFLRNKRQEWEGSRPKVTACKSRKGLPLL